MTARGHSDVVLATMPFAFLHIPSIGLSLLRAGLARGGIAAELCYFTIRFAERIGVEPYTAISTQPGTSCLAGEWLFSAALFDDRAVDMADYLEKIVQPRTRAASDAPRSSVRFVDMLVAARAEVEGFLDECVDTVLAHQPRLVGLTSVFQQHVASLALARRLKRRAPETTIILGGPNCEDVLGIETVRQFDFVDAVVLGEGDIAFPEVVRRALDGAPLTGIDGVYTPRAVRRSLTSQRHYEQAALVRAMDSLPRTTYDDYFQRMQEATLDRPVAIEVPFETSRGCWWGEKHHCTFCGLNDATMAYRSKSPAEALAEISELGEKYGDRLLVGTDAILNMRYFEDLLPELAARRLGLNIFFEVKANLKKEQLRLMRDAGITSVQSGIESLSTPILRMIDKGSTGLQNLQLLKWCETFGIVAAWNLLWNFPGEPPEEYAAMAALAPAVHHLRPPEWMGPITLVRFSPYFEQAERFGLRELRQDPAYDYVYPALPPAAVFNLAYYFSYRWTSDQDWASYTTQVVEAIFRWRETYRTSVLFYQDDGACLTLWDLRPCATATMTVLEGSARALYLACEIVNHVDGLCRLLGAPERAPVEAMLEQFVAQRQMAREGDRYLSLAIPLEDYGPGNSEAERFFRAEKRGMIESVIAAARRAQAGTAARA